MCYSNKNLMSHMCKWNLMQWAYKRVGKCYLIFYSQIEKVDVVDYYQRNEERERNAVEHYQREWFESFPTHWHAFQWGAQVPQKLELAESSVWQTQGRVPRTTPKHFLSLFHFFLGVIFWFFICFSFLIKNNYLGS